MNDDIATALALHQHILAHDAAGLPAAFQRREAAWAAKFASPANANTPRGLVDLNALALAALARRAGLPLPGPGVYLPLSLLAA